MTLAGLVRAGWRRAPLRTLVAAAPPFLVVGLLALADGVFAAHGSVLRAGLPGLLAVVLLMLPLALVAAPVVEARERGVLRLLATTPVPRGALLDAHVRSVLPVGAAAIAAALAAVLLVPGAAAGLAGGGGSGLLLSAAGILCGALGLLALGIAVAALVAARVRGTARARAISIAAPALVVLASGILPLDELLPGLARACELLPSSLLSGVLAAGLAGETAALPGGIALSAAAVAGAFGLVAVARRVCAR